MARIFSGPFRVSLIGLLGHTTIFYLINQRVFPMRGSVVLAWGLGFAFMVWLRLLRWWLTKRYLITRRRGRAGEKVEHILVIGGGGYIGSVLVRQLLGAGYQVRVLDRLLFGEQSLRLVRGRRDFELLEGDFRDVSTVVRAVHGTDAMVHLGAIVGDPACALDDEMTIEINYAATQMIREVCLGAGVSRLIFASTCSVYGAADTQIHEESRLNAVSMYAASKIASERALLEKHDEQLSPTVLRFATVFGLSPRMRFDLVVNLLAAQAYTEGKIQIFNPDQWRPFIHVQDVGRAVVACLEAPLEVVSGRVFNVGDDSMNYTLGQLGEAVARAIPDTAVQHVERDEDRRNYRVRFDRIRRTLNFRCTRSLENGILEIAGELRAGNIPNFRYSVYNNATFLQQQGKLVGFPRHGVLGAWRRDVIPGEQ